MVRDTLKILQQMLKNLINLIFSFRPGLGQERLKSPSLRPQFADSLFIDRLRPIICMCCAVVTIS